MPDKPTYEQLEKRIHELEQSESELKETKKKLAERIKELDCLRELALLIERPGIRLEALLKDLVNLIPPAWQYPQKTCCRILFNEREYSTEPFYESAYQQHAGLVVRGEKVGKIQVFLFDQLSDDEEPFLPVEQNLLDMIAERLGRVIERFQAEEKLKKREIELREAQRTAQLGRWELDHRTQSLDWSDTVFEIFEVDSKKFGASYEAFLETIHPDDRKMVDAAFTQSLNDGKSYDIVHRLLLKEGRVKWVRESCHTIFDDNEQPIRSVGIVQDITEQKSVENQMRQEHARLKFVIDGSLLGTWEWNLQTGETVFNDTWASMLGYTLDELSPHTIETWIQLTYPDDLTRAKAFLSACIEGKTPYYACELRMKHKDGRWVWIMDRGRVMTCDNDGKPLSMFGTHTDITDLRQSEEQLRATNESLQAILDYSPLLISEIRVDGSYARVNKALAKTFGQTQSSFIGTSFDELLPEDTVTLFMERIAQVTETREALNVEDHLLISDDERHYLTTLYPLSDAAGAIRSIGTIAHDITDRKQAERALRENEERLQLAMEAAHLGMWDWDVQTGRAAYNDKWAELFGYDPDEVEPTVDFFLHCVHPDDRTSVEERLKLHTDGHVSIYESEHRMIRKSGEIIWVLDRGKVMMCDDNGRAIRATGVISNTNELKLTEQALRDRERYLSAVIHTAVDGFWVINSEGRVADVNDAYCSMSGYKRDELTGMGIGDLDARETPEETQARMKRIMTNGSETFESFHRRKDGSVFPVEISTTYLPVDGGRFVCFCRDISERKRFEADIKMANVRLEALWGIAALDEADIETISDHVLKTITHMTDSGYGFYGFVDDNEQGMTIHSWSGDAMKDCAIVDKPTHFPVSEAGLWREAIRKRTPLIVNDYEAENPAKMGLPMGHVEITKLLVVPFFTGNQITSVAAVANRHVDYNQADVANITSFLTGIRAVVDSKRAEEEIKRSYNLLYDLSVLVPGVIYQYRLYPDGSSAFPYSSPGMYDIYEVTPEEVQQDATPVFGRLHPDDADRVSESIFESARTLETFYCEFRVVLPEQGLRWRWSQAQPQRTDDGGTLWHGIILDITERKQVELERERLNTAIEQSGEIVVITDAEGTIQYANPTFEKITGYTLNEAVGQNPRILKSGNQDNDYYRNLWDTISSGKTWNGRLVNKRKNGSLYTEDATISPVFNADGEIVNYVAVKSDITEQIKMEEQYQQVQKLESVGRLAGGVAHDFNNMLSVISGNAELALSSIDTSHPVYPEITEIQNAAQRSADLTRQLLAFARKQTVAPKVINLNTTIESVLKMLGRLIGENIHLSWRPGTELDSVYMDPMQIDQLLANLVVNARDAIGNNGGRVTIETDNVEFDEENAAHHSGLTPGRFGRFVMLAVSDNGCGMDLETQARVFEPFYTTKEQGEGTGLGLATVYGIVKQNQGSINVYSEPGQGTTFKLYLPAHTQWATDETNKSSIESVQLGHQTILLVEDEPAILTLGRKMLERLGYQVIAASTPGEAIRLAQEYDGRIDLLITDVVMPEMNGRDLAKKLLSLYPNINRIFMSGYTANVIAHQGVLDEGVHFIQKPFSLQVLSEKVWDVLDKE